MEVTFSFGEWVRRRRRALDLTQEALAQRINCSVTMIRKIEADARRPSRQMAELLARVLALEPDHHELFLKVARRERAPDQLARIGAPAAAAQVETPAAGPARLPAAPMPLVGREAEMAALQRLLAQGDCRLLTLVGLGGIGKTRLALALAARQTGFADGACFVALAALASPDFVVPSVAEALGLTFAGPAEPKAQLQRHLHQKQLLLVLDNFEHLLEGAGLLSELLEHAPRLKLLVTSRERLRLQGEWVFDLHGLPLPAGDDQTALAACGAVELFVQRAQQAQAGFMLSDENGRAIAAICRLVEGMPLGIELAAAWVPVLSCREIAQDIARNLDFLTASARDLPARHRSLRAAFDHSWSMLAAAERRLLPRLSVFRGGFTRAAAEAVAGADLPALSALVTKSLVRRDQAGRCDLHDLIQQYAADHLAQDAQAETETRSRHSRYYLGLARDLEARLTSHHQKEALQELAAELDNLRAAWEWAVKAVDVPALRAALWSVWYFFDIGHERVVETKVGGGAYGAVSH